MKKIVKKFVMGAKIDPKVALRLCAHGGETRRPYFQVPVTDAENYLKLLLLPDVNDFSDAENLL